MAAIEENFNKLLNEIETKFNNQIKQMTKDVTDGFKTVSERCLGWFKQLKVHVDKNASDIVDIRADMKSLREENNKLRKMVEDLQVDAEYKTSHAFRLQLIAYNIQESDNENVWEVLKVFLTRDLKIDENTVNQIPIRDTHRMGKKENGKVRPIVMAFLRQPDRDFILSQSKNLRNTRLSLAPHLSAKMVLRKKALLAIRKDIKDNFDKRVLAFIGYRAYKPVLLVKVQGRLVEYNESIPWNTLQFSDHVPAPDNNQMDHNQNNQDGDI